MEQVRILIVEDEMIVAESIKGFLLELGYQVCDIVSTGEEALQKAFQLRPTLVLMDIVLAGELDGITTADKIRSGFNIPIIYLTAYSTEEILNRAKITEPFGYIVKPFREKELHSVIEMALYKHRMENQLRESEKRYALAVQAGRVGVWEWDTNTDTIYISPGFKAMLGYQDDEIDNNLSGWKKLIPPDDFDDLVSIGREHIKKGGPPLEVKHTLIHKNGDSFYFLCRGSIVHEENGLTPYRLMGTELDITNNKIMTMKLQEAHNNLEIQVQERTSELTQTNVLLQQEIAERKNAENLITQEYYVQKTISTILRIALEPAFFENQLERILEHIVSLPWLALEAKGCIFLIEENPIFLKLKAHTGFSEMQQAACADVQLGTCICGHAALMKKLIFVDRVNDDHVISYDNMKSHGHYCVPILSGEKTLLGVMCLYVKKGHKRNPKEEEFLLTCANIVAVMVERKQSDESLRLREIQLEEKTNDLLQANTALKVLLEQRDRDKTEMEEKILLNMKTLVLPTLDKLASSKLNHDQISYVELLESKIHEITSPLIKELSSKYLDLTPTEIRIASLIKEGRTTKEIAEMLMISENTITFHRNNIRHKLGIRNERTNLRTYLQNLI